MKNEPRIARMHLGENGKGIVFGFTSVHNDRFFKV